MEKEQIIIFKAAAGINRDGILRKKYPMDSYDIDDNLSSQANALSFCSIKQKFSLRNHLSRRRAKKE
jgi:hypothetical protein